MNNTITKAIGTESLLMSALEETRNAIRYAEMRDDQTAKYILQNVKPLHASIDKMLDDYVYEDGIRHDAYKAMDMLRTACHWSEKAICNYMAS